MRSFLIGLLTCCIFSFTTASPSSDYPSEWSRVDSLMQAGFPRSALEIVDRIYEQASVEQNDPEKVKSILYRLRLTSEFVENFQVFAIEEVRQEIARSTFPVTQILQSILGELYAAYWSAEQYRIRERTPSGSPASADIETWDPATLLSHTIRAYRQSLVPEPDLQAIPVSTWTVILSGSPFDTKEPDSMAVYRNRPTLFDFLAHRALAFFTSSAFQIDQSVNTFQPDHPAFFAPAAKFSQYPLKPTGIRALAGDTYFTPPGTDTLSLRWYAIRIFQSLELFHLNNKDVQPLVQVELERLKYIREQATLANRDQLYREALETAAGSYDFSPASAEIGYALAQFLVEQGHTYHPLQSPDHRWELKEALAVCMKVAERYSDSPGGKNCRALIKEIMAPSLALFTEYAVIPSREALMMIESKAIPSLSFRLLQADPETYPAIVSGLDKEETLKFLNTLSVAAEWQTDLPVSGDYQVHRMESPVPAVSPAFYILFASADASFRNPSLPFTHQPVWSSNLSYVTQRTDSGGLDVTILHRETGQPLGQVVVDVYTVRFDRSSKKNIHTKEAAYRTDKEGFVSIPPPADRHHDRIYLRITWKEDRFHTEDFYLYPTREQPARTSEQTRFYTDRAIYRPLQTIHFKGIVLERTGDSTRLKTGKPTRVVFTDANGRKLAETQFTTDAYGAFSGSFIAPDGVLLGNMQISNESGSVSVSVEAYKRPSFEVLLDTLEGNYKLGQPVMVSGRAVGFAGNPISQATATYQVVRKTTFPYPFRGGYGYMPFPGGAETEIIRGTTTTDAGGTFAIPFDAIPDYTIPETRQPIFRYEVTVIVNDLNGETRTAGEVVSIGYRSLILSMEIAEKLNIREKQICTLSTTNLNGKPTPATVTVLIQKLIPPAIALKTRLWELPDTSCVSRETFSRQFPHEPFMQENDQAQWPVAQTILKTTLQTGSQSFLLLPVPGNRATKEAPAGDPMDPGVYKITLETVDPYGDTIQYVRYITAFDPEAKDPPIPAFSWFVPLTASGEPGETASFLLGTSEKNQPVVREIRIRGKLHSREWLRLNQEQRIIEIPIGENCRGNFSVSFVFVRDNRAYQHTQTIAVPYKSKKLEVSVESFRSKLIPGARETWTLRVQNPDNNGVVASYMTTMYDRSLDQFRSNDWRFDLFQRFFSPNPFEISAGFGTTDTQWSQNLYTEPVPFYSPYYLNWFGLPMGTGNPWIMNRYAYTLKDISSGRMMTAETEPPSAGAPEALLASVPEETIDPANQATGEPQKTATQEEQQIPLTPLRTDFRETAFFYPSLESDTNGMISMSFIVPDALTSWKWLGLAYTRDLFHGTMEKELMTQKDLMVFPNAPRFVRQGDTIVLITKIVNLSDHSITGEATLSLSEAITNQPLQKLIWHQGKGTPETQSFSVPANQSSSVSWTLVIPGSPFLNLLKYRVIASTGVFSDGEENILPVLPGQTMVTESLPLAVRGAGTFRYTFGKLSSSGTTGSGTAKNYRLTLEFASNPAWYAVQALPAMNDMVYRSTNELFGSLYANAMGAHIANSNQQIRQVFESWKALSPETLQSPLEKNQEVKTITLGETPWLAEARNETENRRRLGQFFDMNNLQHHLEQAIAGLMKRQMPSGGWSWFDGMRENQLITLNILTGLGRMEHLGVRFTQQEHNVAAMMQKGVRYLQQELNDDYAELQKLHPGTLEKNRLTPWQIKTLYALSYYNGRFNFGGSEAQTYFLSQAKKYWVQQELMLQGMIALALYRNGDLKTAETIIRSLSEKALHTDEFGMYWASKPGFSWYEAPVERQALLIEAYDEIGPNHKAVEEMKIWLLKQKQTQMWQTREATVEACYALLQRGTDLLKGNDPVDIQLGNQLVNPFIPGHGKPDAGTGYFKISWDGPEIRPDMGNITITKKTAGIAWGGLYWQYFENLDNITAHATPLKVTKELVRTKAQGNPGAGAQGEDATIAIGDVVTVRLVISTDRNMEFVHLKDLRAAGLEPFQFSQNQSVKGLGGDGNALSGYRYQGGLGYYQSTTDAATNFFFDYLPKGTYVIEYQLVANNAGDFSSGMATIQCQYAPEFAAHSEGTRLKIIE